MFNGLNLLAITTPEILAIVLPIAALALGGAGGYFLFQFLAKRKNANAKNYAEKILQEAESEAKSLRKEAILEAKEEIHKQRTELDREIKERRNEIQRSEVRVIQKEEQLTKKEESLDKKIENAEQLKATLTARAEELDAQKEALEQSRERIEQELEKVAGLTREEAKQKLIDAIETDAKREAAVKVKEIEAQAKEEADTRARELVSVAIQKCAADHAAEMTVSVVPLPSDDMKGRIIGREGRNIRALENATGVDLIIDDTPEAVILSGFDPIRREIARITLEKLITDGRIHPARIEEMVEKVRKDMDNHMKELGEAAVYETGVFGLSPELVKILGRLKYRTSYGQNVLKHSIEVSLLAGLLAAELGADVALAKRGGLLHDIGKAVDHEVEGTHISIGVELAKKYKESKEVIHCIAAHHNDIDPESVEAVLVQAADAISGARPGARRESLENYVKRLEKLEGIANSFPGVERSFAIQAGREVRILVKPEEVDDTATIFMAKQIAQKIEQELDYPGQIKVNVIREMRSTEFAK